MTDWLERIGRIAALGEKITVLAENLKTLLAEVEDHQERLTRLETIVEIVRPDGTTLRIAAPSQSHSRNGERGSCFTAERRGRSD